MTLVKVALKNLTRKKVRSIAIILAALLASAFIFGGTAVLYSMGRSVKGGIQKLGADIMVVPAASNETGRKVLLSADPTNFYMDGGNLDRVRSIQGVETASPQLFVSSTKFQCCGMPASLLVGYDPNTDFTIKPWVAGRYQPWKGHEDLDPVTIGARLAMTGNKELRFFGKQFRLGALLVPTGLALIDNSIFMPLDSIRDMIVVSRTKSLQPLMISPDSISSILVKVKPEVDSLTVAKDIEKLAPDVKTIIMKDLIKDVRKDVEVALWGVMALGILCWVMMLVLMGLVFAMTVNERSRELGILRAMGANKLHVFQLLLSEAIMLSGVGAFLGVGLSAGIVINFKQLIIRSLGNISFILSPYILLFGFGCVLFVLLSGALAALYPAVRTCMKEPYDAIHQGM